MTYMDCFSLKNYIDHVKPIRCSIVYCKKGRVGNTGIEANSLQHRGDTLQPLFRMSVYNIVRKHKVLETNLKSEEITNFYRIYLYILALL